RPPLTYRGLLEVLRKAEGDPAIRGVLLEIREPDIGMAKIEGVRSALARLKQSGKKLYVHAEELGTAGMVLAAGADRLGMPEGGVVMLPGVSAEVLYLKGLFGVLGIDWLVIQEKEYKSAFESFVRERMSPELREVLDAILDQRYQAIVAAVAEGRRVPPQRVKEAIDEAILPPARAKELGLIDSVEYRDQFLKAIEGELGGEVAVRKDYGRGSRELDLANPFALFGQIIKLLSPPEGRAGGGDPAIAVVYAEGPITSGKSQASPFGGAGTVGSETLVKAIDEAAGDEAVKAIVLRVDSPGGSGLASDVIWRALWRARERKPVIASLSDVAASGGYYIAMAAHQIVAEPGTITGSIGVIAARPSLERLLGFWGVRVERLQRGRNAGLFDIWSAPGDSEREALAAYVGGFYREFVAKVARSRGLGLEEVANAARGRVWTGAQAKERKLIDELGGLDHALELARKRAGLPEGTALRVVELPEPPNLFESLSEAFEMRLRLGEMRPFLLASEGRELLSRILQLQALAREPALAILPFEVRIR
ncbi:MAG: signal peptide peptidase SppA, partial [Thermoanaerobaculia bacterium]